jgi:hypothetical protein
MSNDQNKTIEQTLEQKTSSMRNKLSLMEKVQDYCAGLEMLAGFGILSGTSITSGIVLTSVAYPVLIANMNPYLTTLSAVALCAVPTALCGLTMYASKYISDKLDSEIAQKKVAYQLETKYSS